MLSIHPNTHSDVTLKVLHRCDQGYQSTNSKMASSPCVIWGFPFGYMSHTATAEGREIGQRILWRGSERELKPRKDLTQHCCEPQGAEGNAGQQLGAEQVGRSNSCTKPELACNLREHRNRFVSRTSRNECGLTSTLL